MNPTFSRERNRWAARQGKCCPGVPGSPPVLRANLGDAIPQSRAGASSGHWNEWEGHDFSRGHWALTRIRL